MRPKLKLNHIQTLHDARYCSAVGVELLAFDLNPNSDFFIEPKAIGEIMGWLSGPESVGEFLYETPDEIQAAMQTAQLNWVSLPIDYPTPTATDITAPLIFRSSSFDSSILNLVSELSSQFPEAIFELPIDELSSDEWQAIPTPLISRIIIATESPDPVYDILKKEGVKPYAFALGDFVEEPDGQLDYETCDEFVESFHSLSHFK